MGAKLSRRKSDGAGAPTEQKSEDLQAETMPQVDITPKDFTSQDAVSEEPKDVLNKAIETVDTMMASVGLEDSAELEATDLIPEEAKTESLTCFSQEALTKTEFSISESPADPALILWEPLTTENPCVPDAPERAVEAFGDANVLPMKNEEGSNQDGSEIEEMLMSVHQDDP